MMLPLLISLGVKSFILLFWTSVYGLVNVRSRVSSSELAVVLGAGLLLISGVVGMFGLEFFLLLTLLIYASAILILFLFAFFIIPLDSPVTAGSGVSGLHMPSEVSPSDLLLSLVVFIGSGHYLERLCYLRVYYIQSVTAAFPSTAGSNSAQRELVGSLKSGAAPTWLDLSSLLSAWSGTISSTRSRGAEHLAAAMYSDSLTTVGIAAAALLVVMGGTLRWLRNAGLKQA